MLLDQERLHDRDERIELERLGEQVVNTPLLRAPGQISGGIGGDQHGAHLEVGDGVQKAADLPGG